MGVKDHANFVGGSGHDFVRSHEYVNNFNSRQSQKIFLSLTRGQDAIFLGTGCPNVKGISKYFYFLIGGSPSGTTTSDEANGVPYFRGVHGLKGAFVLVSKFRSAPSRYVQGLQVRFWDFFKFLGRFMVREGVRY